MNQSPRSDDSLRDLLRTADPYRGEEMPPGVATRIRQRAREQAAARRLVGGHRSMIAVAGVIVTALAIWIASTATRLPSPVDRAASASRSEAPSGTSVPRASEPETAAPDAFATETLEAGAVLAEASAPDAPVEASGGDTPDTQLAAARTADSEATSAAPDSPMQPATLALNRTAATARNIRFTAPRGTRIIWSVNPDLPETTNRPAPAPRLEPGVNSR